MSEHEQNQKNDEHEGHEHHEHEDHEHEGQEEYMYDVIILEDDEGGEHQFELVDEVTVDEHEYRALLPIAEDPEEDPEDAGQLLIMRVSQEDGDDYLDTIDDDEEYEKIAAIFMDRLSDDFEFEETFEED